MNFDIGFTYDFTLVAIDLSEIEPDQITQYQHLYQEAYRDSAARLAIQAIRVNVALTQKPYFFVSQEILKIFLESEPLLKTLGISLEVDPKDRRKREVLVYSQFRRMLKQAGFKQKTESASGLCDIFLCPRTFDAMPPDKQKKVRAVFRSEMKSRRSLNPSKQSAHPVSKPKKADSAKPVDHDEPGIPGFRETVANLQAAVNHAFHVKGGVREVDLYFEHENNHFLHPYTASWAFENRRTIDASGVTNELLANVKFKWFGQASHVSDAVKLHLCEKLKDKLIPYRPTAFDEDILPRVQGGLLAQIDWLKTAVRKYLDQIPMPEIHPFMHQVYRSHLLDPLVQQTDLKDNEMGRDRWEQIVERLASEGVLDRFQQDVPRAQRIYFEKLLEFYIDLVCQKWKEVLIEKELFPADVVGVP